MDRAKIKRILLEHGFKEKLQEQGILENVYDLDPYVYTAVEAVISEVGFEIQTKLNTLRVSIGSEQFQKGNGIDINEGLGRAAEAVEAVTKGSTVTRRLVQSFVGGSCTSVHWVDHAGVQQAMPLAELQREVKKIMDQNAAPRQDGKEK